MNGDRMPQRTVRIAAAATAGVVFAAFALRFATLGVSRPSSSSPRHPTCSRSSISLGAGGVIATVALVLRRVTLRRSIPFGHAEGAFVEELFVGPA